MKETGVMNVHIQTGLEQTTLLKLSWVKTRSSWTQSQHLHLDYWSRSWGTAWFLFRLLREMLLNFPSREGREDHPSVRCLKIRLLSRFGGVYTKDLADKNTITPEKNRAHPFFPATAAEEWRSANNGGKRRLTHGCAPPPPTHGSAAMTSEPVGSPGEVRVKGERVLRAWGCFPVLPASPIVSLTTCPRRKDRTNLWRLRRRDRSAAVPGPDRLRIKVLDKNRKGNGWKGR